MKLPPLLRPRPYDIAIASLFCVPWAGLQVAGAFFARDRPPPTHVVVIPPGERKEALRLEVADSKTRQRQGLSDRVSLPPGEGMYFPVRPPGRPRLWMKGVTFPLDIVFVRDGRVTEVLYSVPPCDPERRCPVYVPRDPVDGVLELPAGESLRLGLCLGTTLGRLPYASNPKR